MAHFHVYFINLLTLPGEIRQTGEEVFLVETPTSSGISRIQA